MTKRSEPVPEVIRYADGNLKVKGGRLDGECTEHGSGSGPTAR